MKVDVKLVKELRKLTSAGVMDCKKAIEEAEGDIQQAVTILRKKGISKANKKSDRETGQGLVVSYIHFNGQLGALLEILCETDFVSGNEDFKKFGETLAMQVAAAQPIYLSKEEVTDEILDRERDIYTDQFKDSKKPADIIKKIVENKISKYYEENCLLQQEFLNEDLFKGSVDEYLKENIAKFGENIKVSKFSVFKIG